MQPRVRDLKGVFALYGIFFDKKICHGPLLGVRKIGGFFGVRESTQSWADYRGGFFYNGFCTDFVLLTVC